MMARIRAWITGRRPVKPVDIEVRERERQFAIATQEAERRIRDLRILAEDVDRRLSEAGT